MSFCPPNANCSLCPRLVQFRNQNKSKFPHYHNGAVESFGSLNAQILIVGLAPGLNGANQTNRPFTNDYAGDVLYPCLKKFGFAIGESLGASALRICGGIFTKIADIGADLMKIIFKIDGHFPCICFWFFDCLNTFHIRISKHFTNHSVFLLNHLACQMVTDIQHITTSTFSNSS